jgi:hypothetical protein
MADDDLVSRMSKSLAIHVDRRGFMRRTARRTFMTTALLAAGGAVEVMKGAPAFAYATHCASSDNPPVKGKGCPGGGNWGSKFPCGPDPCCVSYSGACNCSTSGAGCKSNSQDIHCHGKASTWSGAACWTCTGPAFPCKSTGCHCNYVTTCCDCRLTGCSSGICISYSTTTIGPFC